MRIPFLSRLMEIKEFQVCVEVQKLKYLKQILKELKGGLNNGKS